MLLLLLPLPSYSYTYAAIPIQVRRRSQCCSPTLSPCGPREGRSLSSARQSARAESKSECSRRAARARGCRNATGSSPRSWQGLRSGALWTPLACIVFVSVRCVRKVWSDGRGYGSVFDVGTVHTRMHMHMCMCMCIPHKKSNTLPYPRPSPHCPHLAHAGSTLTQIQCKQGASTGRPSPTPCRVCYTLCVL